MFPIFRLAYRLFPLHLPRRLHIVAAVRQFFGPLVARRRLQSRLRWLEARLTHLERLTLRFTLLTCGHLSGLEFLLALQSGAYSGPWGDGMLSYSGVLFSGIGAFVGCGSGRGGMIDTDVAPRGAGRGWTEGEGTGSRKR
jgi:hypothetical protein